MGAPICTTICGAASAAAAATAALALLPVARLEKDSGQVIPLGGGSTPVTFEVEPLEVGNIDADAGTDSITILEAGIYELTQEVAWASNGVTGGVVTTPFINGVALPWILRDDMVAAEAIALGKTTTLELAAGDVITLEAINSSAANRTLTNASLTLTRIR